MIKNLRGHPAPIINLPSKMTLRGKITIALIAATIFSGVCLGIWCLLRSKKPSSIINANEKNNELNSISRIEKLRKQITVYGAAEWKDLGIDVDNEPEPPNGLESFLNQTSPHIHGFDDNKKICDTFGLFLIPKLKYENINDRLEINRRCDENELKNATDEVNNDTSRWILMSKNCYETTLGESLADEKASISDNHPDYRIPTLLEWLCRTLLMQTPAADEPLGRCTTSSDKLYPCIRKERKDGKVIIFFSLTEGKALTKDKDLKQGIGLVRPT